MASIQSLGIGSGLLSNELVDDIIATEREPAERRLDFEQELVEAKITAYGEVVSSVSSFGDTLQTLSLPSTFSISTATSTSEDFVTATASSVSVPGSYVVEVSSLAQNHSVATEAYAELDDVIGTGSLTFRFGSTSFDIDNNYESFTVNADAKTKTIAITSTNNTLAGIRDAINDADFGVQAGIVDDGSGYRLLFTSKEAGAENSLEIVVTGDDGLKALNYNLASESSTRNAVTATGSVDVSGGGGLDTDDRTFSLDYNGVALDVLVSSDPSIDTTAEVIAAVQSALDTELAAKGFSAGDITVADVADKLLFSTLATGFDTSLELTGEGDAASLSTATTISDGFDFAANNASFSIAIDGGSAQAIVLNTASADRQETVDLLNQAFLSAGIDGDVVASLNVDDEILFTRTATGSGASLEVSLIDAAGTAASAELGLAASTDTGLDGFGFNTSAGQVTGSNRLIQTIQARDASLTVNGLSITRGSNLVVGVISGTTLNLKAVTVGPVTITVDKDPEALIEKVAEFVKAYNDLKVLATELTSFRADEGKNGQGSLLMGDSTLRTVTSGINSLLRSTVSGMTGSIRSLAEVGINTDQNNGFQLTFDAAKFKTKYDEDADTIKALFANAGSVSDSQLKYLSSDSSTIPGTYDIEIDSLATVGTYQGLTTNSLAAGNIVIDDDNDNFSISLNDIDADITLTQGTYTTAEELAAQIQAQINSDTTYENGNHSVSVVFNAVDNRFEMKSNIYGKSSEVIITATESNVAETLGFVLATQGPFQGNQLAGLATANGLSSENFTTAITLDAETSFSLSIDGVSTGLMTIPGSSGTPVTYNTPDDLIAAVTAQINSDGAFLAQAAGIPEGDALTAGMDFSASNRSLTLSLDEGETDIEVLVNGDAENISFGGETPGTLANSLAAVQDAIDATALNGFVTVSLDADDQIIFTSTGTGAGASLQLSLDGTAAQMVTASAVNDGFDFSSSNATFDISIDGETAITLTIDTLTADRNATAQEVQNALDLAGIGNRVLVSLDASDQLTLTRSDDSGVLTSIVISNVNGTAAAELGLADSTDSGLAGFGLTPGIATGIDAKNVTTTYVYDEATGLGRFVFSTDDNSDVLEFDLVSTNASNELGIFIGDGS